MDLNLEDDMSLAYSDLHDWTNPPKKTGKLKFQKEPLLFNALEESARSIAQACILSYGIRFQPSAISELYSIIEEAVINIKQLGHEDDFSNISEAQKNLTAFIADIVTTAQEKKLTTVSDDIVKEVRKIQFCPVYPFT